MFRNCQNVLYFIRYPVFELCFVRTSACCNLHCASMGTIKTLSTSRGLIRSLQEEQRIVPITHIFDDF